MQTCMVTEIDSRLEQLRWQKSEIHQPITSCEFTYAIVSKHMCVRMRDCACLCILTTVRESQSGQQLPSSSFLDAAQLLCVSFLPEPQFDPHVLTGAVQRVSSQDPVHTNNKHTEIDAKGKRIRE